MIIYIDGPDGCGKSTLACALSNAVNNSIITRAPGSPQSSICCSIRDLVFRRDISVECSYQLIWADLYQLFDEVISKNIDKLIILDRFIPSTYTYQGLLLGTPIKYIEEDTQRFYNRYKHLWPSLGIYLKPAIQTIKDRLTIQNKYDEKTAKDIPKMISRYNIAFDYISQYNQRDIVINAENNLEKTIQELLQVIEDMRGENNG